MVEAFFYCIFVSENRSTIIISDMIQQDYILRLVAEFFEALRLLSKRKKDVSDKLDALDKLYNDYLGDSQFCHVAEMDEVMESFKRWPEQERIHRMEMLAELYYVEANLKEGLPRQLLQERALLLFSFIDAHSDTFSFERLQKISELEKHVG